MNPNSTHQIWSRWTFTVTPGRTIAASRLELEQNCGRFGRKAFGSASEMRITTRAGKLIVDVRTEGHPVHEAAYVAWMRQQWTRFFRNGFGNKTRVDLETKLEAGSRQDGRPADQLIVLPPMAFHL